MNPKVQSIMLEMQQALKDIYGKRIVKNRLLPCLFRLFVIF